MKLSMENYTLRTRLGEEEALRAIQAAGFDAVDYSFYGLHGDTKAAILGDGYLEHARGVRALLDEIGLPCNQAHAAFAFDPRKEAMSPESPHYLEVICSIEAAAVLGAPHIVVHAVAAVEGETKLETNLRYYRSLIPICARCGIKVAIENIFDAPYDKEQHIYTNNYFDRPALLHQVLDELPAEYFDGLVDVGHCPITGIEPQDFLREFGGERLCGLHIHDNDRRDDHHQLPFYGKLDWNAIMDTLASIGYRGDLTLEILGSMNHFRTQALPDVLDFAARLGRRLIARFEA